MDARCRSIQECLGCVVSAPWDVVQYGAGPGVEWGQPLGSKSGGCRLEENNAESAAV